jgi:hypothetical protein
MALLKQISTDYGIYASYWKITHFALNLDGSCDLKISGFYSKETRDAGMLSLKNFDYHIDAVVVLQYFPSGMDLTQVYQYLKTINEFVGAEDA